MAKTRLIKMKVPVETLLTGARAKRSELVQQHEAATEKYERDIAQFQEVVVTRLNETAALIERDGIDAVTWEDSYRKGRYVNDLIKIPIGERPEPPDTPSADEINEDIALLSATSETELVLSTEDRFAHYLTALEDA